MKTINILLLTTLLTACTTTSQQESATSSVNQSENTLPITETKQETVANSLHELAEQPSTPTLPVPPLELNGTLVLPPSNQLTITLPMGGIVTSFNHLPGKFIRKGALIATIQNLEFVELQQSYLEAAAQTVFLEKEYERQQAMANEEATTQKRVQESRAAYLTSKSKYEAAEAHLRLLGIDAKSLVTNGIQAELPIYAPQSGYLSDITVNQGKYVDTGQPICQLIDMSKLYLQLTAYEKELSRIQVGEKVTFCVNGVTGDGFKAEIESIDQRVDPSIRSVQIYAKVTVVDERFKPGMYVIATFTTE